MILFCSAVMLYISLLSAGSRSTKNKFRGSLVILCCALTVADSVSQVRKFLANFVSVCGVMKVFDHYSVRSFLFELIRVVEYIVFFEVLDEISVCFRCRTV